MRKLLALLLLAILPVTPSWAGVAVDCSGGAAVAQAAPAPAPGEEPACCGEAAAPEVQCGSDCSHCHGPGLTALTGFVPNVGVMEAAAGDCAHACRIADPAARAPLRPPSAGRG